LVLSAPHLEPGRARRVQIMTFKPGRECFSAERMDSWGAQYSGASPVSPYLSCTRAGVVCTHDDREYLYLVAKRHPTKHLI
jgi:hypothetical protein